MFITVTTSNFTFQIDVCTYDYSSLHCCLGACLVAVYSGSTLTLQYNIVQYSRKTETWISIHLNLTGLFLWFIFCYKVIEHFSAFCQVGLVLYSGSVSFVIFFFLTYFKPTQVNTRYSLCLYSHEPPITASCNRTLSTAILLEVLYFFKRDQKCNMSSSRFTRSAVLCLSTNTFILCSWA